MLLTQKAVYRGDVVGYVIYYTLAAVVLSPDPAPPFFYILLCKEQLMDKKVDLGLGTRILLQRLPRDRETCPQDLHAEGPPVHRDHPSTRTTITYTLGAL
jgi:hypothetical protein